MDALSRSDYQISRVQEEFLPVFSFLDRNGNGSLTKNEMRFVIASVFSERLEFHNESNAFRV